MTSLSMITSSSDMHCVRLLVNCGSQSVAELRRDAKFISTGSDGAKPNCRFEKVKRHSNSRSCFSSFLSLFRITLRSSNRASAQHCSRYDYRVSEGEYTRF
jgi:hypothetical protein